MWPEKYTSEERERERERAERKVIASKVPRGETIKSPLALGCDGAGKEKEDWEDWKSEVSSAGFHGLDTWQ